MALPDLNGKQLRSLLEQKGSSRPFFKKGSVGLILRVVFLVQPATKPYRRHQGSVFRRLVKPCLPTLSFIETRGLDRAILKLIVQCF
jgi:hypothetical protein